MEAYLYHRHNKCTKISNTDYRGRCERTMVDKIRRVIRPEWHVIVYETSKTT
jgi:hypothetical protein